MLCDQLCRLLAGHADVATRIATHYAEKGVTELFQWQHDVLQVDGVLEGKSIIYTAPTSGGKSLVVELLIARAVLSLCKRCILVVPFVSLAQEKIRDLQGLFSGTSARVLGFFHDSKHREDAVFDVAVCTIEKANFLLTHLMRSDAVGSLALVAVDELHLVGDEQRGYLLEILLTKLNFLSAFSTPVQVVGLTATLGNLETVAEWLGAALYQSEFRPVHLQEYFVLHGQVFRRPSEIPPLTDQQMCDLLVAKLPPPPTHDTGRLDSDFLSVVWSSLNKGNNVLVFCATKNTCEAVALSLVETLPPFRSGLIEGAIQTGRETIVNALKLYDGQSSLAECIGRGGAFHHSGLSSEERLLVERGFTDGFISVICATSTLAAGVNLPARRVVFHSPYIANQLLDSTRYRQMSGRAGRAGFGGSGESVMCISNASEVEAVMRLMTAPCDNANSGLLGQGHSGLTRAILEVVASFTEKFAHAEIQDSHLEALASATLAARTLGAAAVLEAVQAAAALLTRLGMIQRVGTGYAASRKGVAAANAHLCPLEAAYLFSEAEVVSSELLLDTDAQLTYLVAPLPGKKSLGALLEATEPELNLPTDFRLLKSLIRSSGARNLMWMENRLGVRTAQIDALANRKTCVGGSTGLPLLLQIRLWRLQNSLLLSKLISGTVTLRDVAKALDTSRGSVQALQMTTFTMAHNTVRFFECLEWWQLASMLRSLLPCLRFGVTPEVVPLLKCLPEVPVCVARALFTDMSITSPGALVKAPKSLLIVIAKALVTQRCLLKHAQRIGVSEADTTAAAEALIALAKRTLKEKKARVFRQSHQCLTTTGTAGHPSETNAWDAKPLKDSTLKSLFCMIVDRIGHLLATKQDHIALMQRQMDYTQPQNTIDPVTTTFIAPIGNIRSTLISANASDPVLHPHLSAASGCLKSVQGSNLVHVSLFDSELSQHTDVRLTVATGKEVFLLNELPPQVLQSVLQSLKGVIVLYSPSAFRWDLRGGALSVQLAAERLGMDFPAGLDAKTALWLLQPDRFSSAPDSWDSIELAHSFCHQERLGSSVTYDSSLAAKSMRAMTITIRLLCYLDTSDLELFSTVEANFIRFAARMAAAGCPLNPEASPPPSYWLAAAKTEATTLQNEFRRILPYLGPDLDPLPKTALPDTSSVARYNQLVHITKLLRGLCQHGDRVHARMRVNATVTGRLALSSPNLLGFDKMPVQLTLVAQPLPAGRRTFPFECLLDDGTAAVAVEPERKSEDVKVIVGGEQRTVHSSRLLVASKESTVSSLSIRRFIGVPPKRVLLSVDYSQIELRLLCHFSEDPALLKGFHTDVDFFACMAGFLVEKPSKNVTAEERALAKKIMYSVLYGMGAATLMEQLGLERQEQAESLITAFFDQFPTLKAFLDKLRATVLRVSHVTTLLGRQVPLSSEHSYKAASYLCQSSAAEVVKLACAAVDDWIRGSPTQAVLQVHDELLIETDEYSWTRVRDNVIYRMMNAVEIAVPLRVNCRYVGTVPKFLADYGVKTRDAAHIEDLQAKFEAEAEVDDVEDHRELVDDLEAAVIVNPDVIEDEPPEEPIEDDVKRLTEDREGLRTLKSDEISELASRMRFRKSAPQGKKRLATAEDKEKEMSRLKGMKRFRQESTSTKKPSVQLSFDEY